MKIFLDVDDTVYKSCKRLVEYLNVIHNKDVNYRDIKQYNCQDQFPETSSEEVEEIFKNLNFYEDIEIFKGVKKTIEKLSLYHEIYFLTKGTAENIYYKTLALQRDFPNIPVITLSMMLNKDLIDMTDSVIIDDVAEYILSSNADYKILFAPNGANKYNEKAYGLINSFCNEVYIADSWKQIRRILNNIEVL